MKHNVPFLFLSHDDAVYLTGTTRELNRLSDTELECAARTLRWGTYGPTGTDRLSIKYLNDLDTDHLENILVTQYEITELYRKVILYILKRRLGV